MGKLTMISAASLLVANTIALAQDLPANHTITRAELTEQVVQLERGDTHVSNEAQTLSINGNELSLSPVGDIGGGTITLPQGAKGEAGDQGPQGPTGPIGTQGSIGASGPQGEAGIAGAAGTAGIKGETGLRGAKGAIGPSGTTGEPGLAGPPGAKGATGERGRDGRLITYSTCARGLLVVGFTRFGSPICQ